MALSNPGYCPICAQKTYFIAAHEWLRDFYLCSRCGTAPRQRAVVEVLNAIEPQWQTLSIHESSPCIDYFAEKCPRYTCSYYFEDVPLGFAKDGRRCENLEQLTFPDSAFDIFLTQDVLEHVFRPELAVREIARVLKPGGIHVFTAPKHKTLLKSYPRARQTAAGQIEYLLPPEYHGNPIGDGRSLVTWDYGADFDDLLAAWSGYLVSNYLIRDRARGIDGEFLDVFVMRKDSVNLLASRGSKKPGGPLWNIESVGECNRAWENTSFELPFDRELVVSGWAVDRDSKRAAGGVEILIDGIACAAQHGRERPDVAAFFNTAAYADSGYVLKVPAGQVAAGSHILYVRILANDRQGYWEVGPYTLTVK
jgi:SAM-dependent methyltransferase